MSTEYIFSTPIYRAAIEDDVVHDEIDRYINAVDESCFTSPWQDNVSTTFGYYKQILEYTPRLKKEIENHCCNFLVELGISYNIKILESWVNITKNLQFQHFHIHDDEHISGVFYHQTSGDDGDIVFHHPSLANRCSRITKKISSPISFKPQKSKLIMFPSFLEHAVDYNKTQNSRISVAFNIRLY